MMERVEIIKRINDWYAETNIKKEDWISLIEKFDKPRVRVRKATNRLRVSLNKLSNN